MTEPVDTSGRASEVASAAQAQPLRRVIYERIRAMIFRGELAPGARLSPLDLAERFEVSATPVREALRALAEEGLVEVEPRKWTRVAALNPELLDEVYPLLAELERFAVATAPAVPLEAIAAAKRANAELVAAAAAHDVVGCIRADARFHETLVDLNPNEILKAMIAALKARTYMLESTYYRVDGASRSVEQHAEIIESLLRNDLQQAGETVAANWAMGHARLRRALAE